MATTTTKKPTAKKSVAKKTTTAKKTVPQKVVPKKPKETLVEEPIEEKKVLTEEVTPEDITKGKQDAIKTLSGVDNLDLENLSDEELDSLLGSVAKESTETDKDPILATVDKILEADAPKEEVVEKLVDEAKFSKTEAEHVYETHEEEKAEKQTDFYESLFKRGFSC